MTYQKKPLTIAEERKAELTLLALTVGKPDVEIKRVLDTYGVEYAEYLYLLDKYSHVLEKYKEILND